ncbi:protein unc-13 homolog isoform X2, partial [Tanacetum coccineum]
RFISTGQVENDLLFACANLMLEVKDDADSAYDSDYSKILHSTLTLMLDWADKGLFAYRTRSKPDKISFDISFTEKEIYSPILEKWHPLAVGVAVATLHSCYGQQVKAFTSEINDLTPSVIQVLIAADKLEKCLVQMAVEASFYIVDRLAEWVDRSLKKEVWNPMVNKGRFTPTAEEVLRTISDTLEAFFLLPIPMHVALLPDLTNGLDRCLQDYILKAKSGSGTRSNFLPKLPSLTRCSGKTKTNGVFGENNQSQVVEKRKLSTEGDDDSYGIPQLCVRVNTFLYIRKELEVLEKKVITQLNSTGLTHEDSIVNDYRITFKLSLAACQDGTQEICEDKGDMLFERFYGRFLLVLLAGGPSRNFTHEDSSMIKQDFHLLVDLFWANGDGLPIELINKFSATVEGILPLFATDTKSLIE